MEAWRTLDIPAVDVKMAQLAPPSISSLMLLGRIPIAVAAAIAAFGTSAVSATLRLPISAASYSLSSSLAAAALFLVLGQNAVEWWPLVLQVVHT